jgi:hypothetical protein
LNAVDATGAVTYTPAAGYSGADAFTFQASDAQGVSNPATASIVIAGEAPPVSSGPPGVSGSLVVGQTLTCSNGAWSGGLPQTYADQWLSDGGPILGATGTTYVVASADQGHSLSCAVTATNSGGSATATSAGVAIAVPAVVVPPPADLPAPAPAPVAAPANAGLPAITGSAGLGQALTCSPGAWSGTVPQTDGYQWLRDGAAIKGATGGTYTVLAGDVGHSLACAVTAANAAGSATARSAPVAVPLPSSAFTLSAAPKASSTGVITVVPQAPGAGTFSVVATFVESTTAKAASAAKTVKPKTISYGRSSATVKHAGSLALAIHPSKAAKSALKTHGRLRVTIAVTFTPTAGKPRTRSSSLTVKHS